MAADLSGLRGAIEELAGKFSTLRTVIAALQEGQVVQEAIDDLQARVEEIGTELDQIIAEAQGGGEAPGETTPEEPPQATQLPA